MARTRGETALAAARFREALKYETAAIDELREQDEPHVYVRAASLGVERRTGR